MQSVCCKSLQELEVSLRRHEEILSLSTLQAVAHHQSKTADLNLKDQRHFVEKGILSQQSKTQILRSNSFKASSQKKYVYHCSLILYATLLILAYAHKINLCQRTGISAPSHPPMQPQLFLQCQLLLQMLLLENKELEGTLFPKSRVKRNSELRSETRELAKILPSSTRFTMGSK